MVQKWEESEYGTEMGGVKNIGDMIKTHNFMILQSKLLFFTPV